MSSHSTKYFYTGRENEKFKPTIKYKILIMCLKDSVPGIKQLYHVKNIRIREFGISL